jgi:hypothetical protein
MLFKIKKPGLISGLFFILYTIMIFGCSSYNQSPKCIQASINKGYIKKNFNYNNFSIQTLSKIQNKNNPMINVYIEGDGLAWLNKYTPSGNPTPLNPVALKMALRDNSENVIYIGRPCQYVSNENCNIKYWTNARFSKEIINAMNQSLDLLIDNKQDRKISIIGFSGGGVISGLMIAKRKDIILWKTYASPLDTKKWTSHHNISSLEGSEVLTNYIKQIAKIPQKHFLSKSDKIVPPEINDNFFKLLHDNKAVYNVNITNNNNHESWVN